MWLTSLALLAPLAIGSSVGQEIAEDEVLPRYIQAIHALQSLERERLSGRPDLTVLGGRRRLTELDADIERHGPDGRLVAVRGRLCAEIAMGYFDSGLPDVAAAFVDASREDVATLTRPEDFLWAVRFSDHVQARLLATRTGALSLAAFVESRLADEVTYGRGAGRQAGRLLAYAGMELLDLSRRQPERLGRAVDFLEHAVARGSHEPRVRASIALAQAAILRADEAAFRHHMHAAVLRLPRTRLAASAFEAHAGLVREGWGAFGVRLGAAAQRFYLTAPDYAAARTDFVLARAVGSRSLPGVSDAGAFDALRDHYDAFLEGWKRRPLRVGGLGVQLYHEHRWILSELVEQRLAARPGEDGVIDALQEVLRLQALHSSARTLRGTAEAPSVVDVRARLTKPDRGLLVYAFSTGQSHLFLVDAEVVRHVSLPARDRIVEALEGFTGSLFRSRAASDAGPRCREALLPAEALAAMKDWREVTIVGSRVAGLVPFEDLPLASGERLGDTRSIAYLPSVAVGLGLARRAERREESGDGVLLLAAPKPPLPPGYTRAELPELPFGEREARAQLRPYLTRSGRARWILGARAGVERLLELPRGELAMVQIVAHGITDWEAELPATLLLSGNDYATARLTLDHIRRLQVPPLVVLMACSAGQGPKRIGDAGSADFSGALLEAGADAVILSPYSIELHATQELMVVFHRHLSEGASPAAALRRARREAGEAWRREHGFARLRVVGLGHRAVYTR